jgi:hypothetical protein
MDQKLNTYVTSKISIDALNGDIVDVDENGISSPYPFLKSLNEEEVVIFKSFKGKGFFEVRDFLHLGFSEGKIRKTLHSLASKDALKVSKGRRGVTLFQPKIMFPHDFRLLRSISDVLKMRETSKTSANFVSPKIEASDILKRIELYWDAKSNSVDLLYYHPNSHQALF